MKKKSYKILQILDLFYEFYQGFKGLEGLFSNEMRNPIKSFKSLTFSMSFIRDSKDWKDFSSNLNPFQSFKSLTIIYITP